MHDVSNAINILDPSGKDIDGKFNCAQDSDGSSNSTGSHPGQCRAKNSGAGAKLSVPFNSSVDSSKMADTTIKNIATVMTGTSLNREQKGVVSSAFTKAHEGAEIVEIRSISTTSVMVNA